VNDIKYIESVGGKPELLRKKFETDKPSDKIKQLQEMHGIRLQNAVDQNILEAPMYGAIDRALEAAQKNLPFIQARELAESGKTHEEVLVMFKSFGLDRLLEEAVDPVTGDAIVGRDQKPLMVFNRPLFETVFVPLVAGYTEMRIAKLFNDRNQYPRYKFSPPRLSLPSMLASEIVTGRIQRMTQDMGYAEDDKQSFRQMIYYGTCFNFLKERYYRQQYKTHANGKVVSKTRREGVRFAIPHPRRHFWDRTAPLHTLNADTGVSWCGYWDINRWGDIRNNKSFWNLKKITLRGYDAFTSVAWKICQEFYPCVVNLPTQVNSLISSGQHDRIDEQLKQLLSEAEDDSSVVLACKFHRLIPKDWDLFDYDQPIWMRFVYVNTDTCVYCEPLMDAPGYVYLDRYDANKTVAPSQAMQLVPYQQLLGNFLTQHTLSMKQNLLRVSFVNTDIIPEAQVTYLKKLKDAIYHGVRFLTYSKRQDKMLDQDRREAISPLNVAQVNTQETAANIRLTLDVVERMLGFSPQEVGASASHEQSAHEVSITHASTGAGLEFTQSGIDAAWAAKKRLLYTSAYCFGDDEFYVDLNDLTPERRKALEQLGFSVEDGAQDGDLRFTAKGKMASLTMDTFFSDREGVNRVQDSKLGIAMMQLLGQVVAHPVLFQSLGVPQVAQLLNYVFKMVGFPDDFSLKVKVDADQPQEAQQQMMEVLAKAKDAIVQQAVQVVDEQIKKSLAEPIAAKMQEIMGVMAKLMESDAQQNEAFKQILPIVAAVKQLMDAQVQREAQMQQIATQTPNATILPEAAGPPAPVA